MEYPQGPRKPLSQRRAKSLDRSQNPGKDSELGDCQSLSLPATASSQALLGSTSDASSPGSSETPGPRGKALGLEGVKVSLPSEQRAPQDTGKDKAQSRAQHSFLKNVLNFFLRTNPEETKEKARGRAKGKEGLPQSAETFESSGEPAPKKKGHDKKASRKKHGHKKHVEEETKGVQDQEAKGQEAVLPKTSTASGSEEVDLGPRGGEDSDLHQSSIIQGQDAGVLAPSSKATGRWREEELKKLDKETLIQMIVQILREAGDRWEREQCLVSQQEVAPQNPAPAVRKKSQEKMSNLKRSFSHKKHSSEEPKTRGAAGVSSPESRRPKRPSFLYLCVGGHRPSISSSLDLEEPKVQEDLSTDREGLSPFELPTQAGNRGPGEELQGDRDLELKEFIQKIVALLQDEEEQEGEKQLQAQEPEVAVENLASPCRKKSQEKKSSFRKVFSHKKHGSKESKREGAAGTVSLESRSPRQPSYLPPCVGKNESSTLSSLDSEGLEFQESSLAEAGRIRFSEGPSQARSHNPEGRPLPDGTCESKEMIIQRLVALLQEVDGHLGEQIRRHPSFKSFFYQLPYSSLIKLTATLRRQNVHSSGSIRNPDERPYQFAFGLANQIGSSTALSLMGLRYPQLLYREARQSPTSPDTLSPD